MPFLSIIIPVYKVELYLQECLESIAVSELDCWEAILIDDGSPDGCPQICDEYAAKDKRFRVLHQENAGVAAARNAGIDIAKGEWIWFVDSDDVVEMSHVESIIEWLKANEDTLQFTVDSFMRSVGAQSRKSGVPFTDNGVNAPVDLVMFDLDSFKDGEVVIPHESSFSVCNEHLTRGDFFNKYISYFHQQFWFRKSSQFRFTNGIRVSEDLELMYKYCMLCQHPVKIDAMLYHYRRRETSVTQDKNYRAKAIEDSQIVLRNLVEWVRKYEIKPEPWLDFRIMKLMQNLLYSASQVNTLPFHEFQGIIRLDLKRCRHAHFSFPYRLKYRLAAWNVKAYFLFNRLYLKINAYVRK